MKTGTLLNGDLVLGMVNLATKLRKDINIIIKSTKPEDAVSFENLEKVKKDIMKGVDLMLTPSSTDPEKFLKQALDFLEEQ
jgi:hypothetical protein